MRLALTHVYCWPEVVRGGERYLHEVAGAMSRRGHEVTILSTAPSPGVRMDDDVRVVRLRPPRGSDTASVEAAFGRRVLGRLLTGRFDAVHSLGPSDAAASVRAAAAHRRRTTVFTNLGIPARASWERRPDAADHRRVVAGIDAYGCFSAYAASVLESDWGRRAVRTPGGVRLATFQPAARRERVPTLVFSGALTEPRKGLATVLRALPIIARHEPDVRLWLNGPGDVTPLLRAAPGDARERCTVLPSLPPAEQAAVLARAWALVLPARYEAFGMVLLESLACGTPIVGGNHAAIPELVRPGAGVLAEPDDEESVAAACLEAIALARDAGTVDACRAAAAPYDWDAVLAPALERVYAGETGVAEVSGSVAV